MAKTSKPKQPNKKILNVARLAVFWVIMGLLGLSLISILIPSDNLDEVPISDVIRRANDGEISKLEVTGNNVVVTPEGSDEPTERTIKEDGSLRDQGLEPDARVEVVVSEPSGAGTAMISIATVLIPTLLIIGFFVFMMRQAQGQSSQAMSFGKSKAKLYGSDKKKVSFTDVAGNEAAKQDLSEVVDFLKAPKKYEQLGAKIPRGVLLVGSPGTGKTMMARAVASEADVPFFSISGSEFVEMFAGVGASRVRDLFSKAKKNAPCIIFIDEIDAVARRREGRGSGGREEHEQTLNQILVEMDGFENETGVIVMAATNRADMLDPALLRPGRFDRRVTVSLPERTERLAILKVHFKNKPLDDAVDLDALSAKTTGMSGADLANIANEAAIITARNNRKVISTDDVTEAFEKVTLGPERKHKVMSDHERKVTAYHEAGHAVVGHVLPDRDPVHKVTIIPRGQAGGVTWFIPERDRSYNSYYELKDTIASMMGGRQAEKVVFGEDGITTGAEHDLKSASEIARNMVTKAGMGDKLRDQAFLGSEQTGIFANISKPYSEETAKEIDAEMAGIMNEASKRARAILKTNRKHLDILADELLKKETLSDVEVKKILKGAKLPKEAKLYE